MSSDRTDRTRKLREWETLIDGLSFVIPPDRGALWTGLGATRARQIARQLSLVTLEDTPFGESLDHGDFHKQLIADFGPYFPPEARQIFRLVSERFAAALSGRVFILFPDGMTAPDRGSEGSFAFYAKIVWREIMRMDFGNPLIANPRITELEILTVRGGAVSGATKVPQSPYLH